jgi:hypothetical protein
VPCCGSVAEPRNEIVCPTRHVVVEVGSSIVAVGLVLPTVITTVSVALAPRLSVTRRRAEKVPDCVYVHEAVAELPSL